MRRRPGLLLHLELEGRRHLAVVADSFEDQARLAATLTRAEREALSVLLRQPVDLWAPAPSGVVARAA